MSNYSPDRWVILEFKTPEGTFRKVFAGWYGGYTGSDTWKLSSGITSILDNDDHYEILNESGSVYYCYKQAEGFSNYMGMVLSSWKDEMAKLEGYSVTPIKSDLI